MVSQRGLGRTLRALCVLVAAAHAHAQDPFATSVVDFQQGPGSGLFDPAVALGGPRGGGLGSGSVDVVSLGVGGHVTLGFDVTITDGPGADFIVFENGFEFGGAVFAEVAFVEVSSNGVDFARLPSRYDGPPGPLPPFGNVPYGSFTGLVGGVPVLANVDSNMIDPLDPAVGGGDAYDLTSLVGHPLVASGLVQLDAIREVRIVDAEAGVDTDSNGVLVWDNGGALGSADIDAVAVIHHTGNQDPSGPSVDLFIDASGLVHLVIADPDGRSDFDLSSRQVSVNLRPMTFRQLRRWFALELVSTDVLHLVSRFRVQDGPQATLAVSIRDQSGAFAADQISLWGTP